MRSFSIGKRMIGEGAPVFIVAELSANHGHKKDVALRTVEAAAKAGADAIKLQTYTPDTLTLKSEAPDFVVKTKNDWAGRTLWDLYREAMTPWEWHAELKAAAEHHGLEFFSTPFDATAVDFLESLAVPAHKVASFELNDLPLVEKIARTRKPMILSTGMATLGDIEAAVGVCREAGNDQLALLRCVSSYPAEPDQMDLASIPTLASFGTIVGLSDHTRDDTVAVTSVALGAKIIEKHFILDRSVGGPDAFFSLEPAELSSLVRSVRQAERALGKPRFGPARDEVASTAFRRSLFVAQDVRAGQVLTCERIRSVRPSNGLHPRFLPEILGRISTQDLRVGTPLRWEHVGARPKDTLVLRPVSQSDSAVLLQWRNDPTTRRMSINDAEVSQEDHAEWLARSLDAQDRVLLLAEQDDDPIGIARLDATTNGAWEVSITINPTHRGRGLSARLLNAVEEHARLRGVIRLTARIKPENAASVRAFKTAGFYAFTSQNGLLRCERRIARYPGVS